jgi:hypothetical protein
MMEERVARSAPPASVPEVRDIIFIGKATPGDDEFALWLAPRLEAAGYKVFTDINKLFTEHAAPAVASFACRLKDVLDSLPYNRRQYQSSGLANQGIYGTRSSSRRAFKIEH